MHRPRLHAVRFVLIALGMLAAGCNKNTTSPTAPASRANAITPQVSQDVARHFATTLARQGGVPIDRIAGTDLQAIGHDAARGEVPLTAGSSQDEIGFSWSLSVAYFDAANQPQAGYVYGATARAQVLAHARGQLSSAEYHSSVGIERSLSLQGLLPGETTIELDGAANDTASCAFDAADGTVSRSYDLLSLGVLEDIRQPKDPMANPYPLSGVLRWNVRVDAHERTPEGEREAHYDAHVTVIFNGTRHPIIEVQETWRYRMDLETGEITELPA